MAKLTGRKSTNIDDRRSWSEEDANVFRLEMIQARNKALDEAFKKSNLPKSEYLNFAKQYWQNFYSKMHEKPALPSGSPTGFWSGEIPDPRSAFSRRRDFNPMLGTRGGTGVKVGLLQEAQQQRQQAHQPWKDERVNLTDFFADAMATKTVAPQALHTGPAPVNLKMQLMLIEIAKEKARREALLNGAQNPVFNIPRPRMR